MQKNKLLLIDGNSLAYRAFFALPLLSNSQGIHTNAAYGFTMMLQNVLKEHQPSHILVAWDKGKVTFRHEVYSEYKGGRQKTPNELREQFPIIREILEAYGIQQYELESYEADDIIGTMSQQSSEEMEVIIISGDKDLTQLASTHTTVLITKKGITEMEEYTPETIVEKYGLTPKQIIDMKGLMGDKSDNIPGVPSVGEKTAIKLLKEYGSVEGVYEHLDKITAKKLNENLTTYQEQAFLSKQLATIDNDSPVEISVSETQYEGPNYEALLEVFNHLESKNLIQQVVQEMKEKGIEADVVLEEQPEIDTSFETVALSDGATYVEQLPKEAIVHLELYGEQYFTEEILGLVITPLNESEGKPIFFTTEEIEQQVEIHQYLENPEQKKYMLDSKATMGALSRFGITVEGVAFDFELAAYIADAGNAQKSFAQLAVEQGFHFVTSDEEIYGKGAKKKVPAVEIYQQHSVLKTLAMRGLIPLVIEQLKASEQYELYQELELPLASILSQMERQGIKVEVEVLQTLGKDLSLRLDQLEQQIYSYAGESFNINSPKQLGVILFEKIGLTPIKKTKTGYSTAADVLEKLEKEHEIVSLILLYRQLGKLNSTYVEGLQKEIHSDGKIHTTYQQALTTTGRLSSIHPNLQNIPIRIEEGRKIRQAFVPSEKGWQLLAADYSQIELRVLAHISEDEMLIDAFKRGADIHTETAMNVFGVTREEVDSQMRRTAKAVNFGIIYGISDYGLSQNLNITRKEAQHFIDTYLNTYSGVRQYMKQSVSDAKEKGYAQTLLNRRRFLPDLNSSSFNIRSFAERTAMNTPIQGSAADIIKKAMIDMQDRLIEEGLSARMLLQVHDELIFEAPMDEIERLQQLVPEVMEQTVQLLVPLKADVAIGHSWYEMD